MPAISAIGLVNGARPELPPAQIRYSAGIAVETAAPGGMHQIDHLHALVIVELAVEDIPAGRADQGDIGPLLQIIVAGLAAGYS